MSATLRRFLKSNQFERMPVMNFERVLYAGIVALMAINPIVSKAELSSDKSSHELPARLDSKLTPDNSFLQDVGYGIVIRLPKSLYPTLDFARMHQPVAAPFVDMTFIYPDMTLSGWDSPIDIAMKRRLGNYVPPTADRFQVRIIWMFYSSGELGNIPWDRRMEMPFPDARPPRMLESRVSTGGYFDSTRREPTFTNSKYFGLKEVNFNFTTNQAYEDRLREQAKKAGGTYSHGKTYIETSGAPYELIMDCEAPEAIKCQAYVYSKKNHFQYRMIFPVQAVSRTDELIRAINRMIDEWVQK